MIRFSNPVMFCTGKGTHEPQVAVCVDDPVRPGRREPLTRTEIWRCPQCGRELRLGTRKLRLLTSSGLDRIDISRMPF